MDLLSKTPKDLLKMCCVCKKIFININEHFEWIDETHPMYQDLIEIYRKDVTHGYCDVCFEREMYHDIILRK